MLKARFVTEVEIGEEMIIVSSEGVPLGFGKVESFRGSYFYMDGERYYNKGLDGKHHRYGDFSVSAMSFDDALDYIPSYHLEELRKFPEIMERLIYRHIDIPSLAFQKEEGVRSENIRKFKIESGLGEMAKFRGGRKPQRKKGQAKPKGRAGFLDKRQMKPKTAEGEKPRPSFDEIRKKIGEEFRALAEKEKKERK